MLKAMEGLHHWLARRIAGKMDRHKVDGVWELTPVADSLEISGLFLLKEYIQRRQANIVM